MPLLQETNQTNPQTENQTNSPSPNPTNKGLFTLPDSVMKLVPWIPFLLEATTGQKIPQMSGTIGEMQMSLININTNLQTIVNTQQNLNQRLTGLETKLIEIQNSANQHLSNLTNQFNSLRLTHTREKKEIEYNPNPNKLETENY